MELSAVGTKELSRALDKQVVRELKCVCVSVKKTLLTPQSALTLWGEDDCGWLKKKLKDTEHYIQAIEAFL